MAFLHDVVDKVRELQHFAREEQARAGGERGGPHVGGFSISSVPLPAQRQQFYPAAA